MLQHSSSSFSSSSELNRKHSLPFESHLSTTVFFNLFWFAAPMIKVFNKIWRHPKLDTNDNLMAPYVV